MAEADQDAMPGIPFLFALLDSSDRTGRRHNGVSRVGSKNGSDKVVTLVPTCFDYWMGCEIALSESQLSRPVHNEQLNSSPKEYVQQAMGLVEWAGQLQRRFGKCVPARLVDAISLERFWLSRRHRVRRYPASINGRIQPPSSGDLTKLDGFISQEVALGWQPRYAEERR